LKGAGDVAAATEIREWTLLYGDGSVRAEGHMVGNGDKKEDFDTRIDAAD